jgi:hypothetical protein
MKRLLLEIKWAVIFTLVGLLWMWGEKCLGLHDIYIDKHPVYTMFFIIPAVAVYVVALYNVRKKYYGGSMTYLQGFISGLIMTGFITILSPLSQYITSTYITPDYFTNAINYAVKQGYSTRPEAQAYFTLKSYIIQGLLGAPIMGVVTSAIVAAITKKSGPSFRQ